MEIKSRFDEERNLHWAAELERVGAHVTFGVSGLKTHAKTALVVRKEGGGLRCYVHIGTGNYHVRTARLYVDLGLLTCDPQLTHDVVNLFHFLTGHAHAPACTSLLFAPSTMRPRLLALIEREITNRKEGRPARIVAKMNQIEDPEMIQALCEASEAGVPIDLIIRGFCCLRPGVPDGRTTFVCDRLSADFWNTPASSISPMETPIQARETSLSAPRTGCSGTSRNALRW
jgi:polyphosphate kinase